MITIDKLVAFVLGVIIILFISFFASKSSKIVYCDPKSQFSQYCLPSFFLISYEPPKYISLDESQFENCKRGDWPNGISIRECKFNDNLKFHAIRNKNNQDFMIFNNNYTLQSSIKLDNSFLWGYYISKEGLLFTTEVSHASIIECCDGVNCVGKEIVYVPCWIFFTCPEKNDGFHMNSYGILTTNKIVENPDNTNDQNKITTLVYNTLNLWCRSGTRNCLLCYNNQWYICAPKFLEYHEKINLISLGNKKMQNEIFDSGIIKKNVAEEVGNFICNENYEWEPKK